MITGNDPILQNTSYLDSNNNRKLGDERIIAHDLYHRRYNNNSNDAGKQ